MRVLKIRHETIRAAVERVDDHLAVNGAGDLHAPILQIRRHRIHAPIAFAHTFCFSQKIGKLAGINRFLADLPLRQQFEPSRVEFAVQLGKKLERFRRENFRVRAIDGREHFEIVGQFD